MPQRRAPSTSSDDSEPSAPRKNVIDSETESDSQTTTAKAMQRLKPKRRRSAPFADASNGPDYSVPLKDDSTFSPNPNLSSSMRQRLASSSGFTEVDDRAEKRKRRKSARVSFAPPDQEDEDTTSGSHSRQDASGSGSGSGAVAVDLDRSSGLRSSMRTGRLSAGTALRINAVTPAPLPAISMDIMNSNFEEWMKMATDNVG
jgi:condensin complex subunit 2